MTTAEFLIALVAIATTLCANMSVSWLVQRATGNSGWVDVFWTFGVGFIGAISALLPSTDSPRALLVAGLAAIWSMRLGLHLVHRTLGITDDPRYAQMKRRWGPDAQRRMFGVLMSQAAASIPLALAIFLAARNPEPGLRIRDFLGAAILLIGIFGEGVADNQLRRFKAAHLDGVCDVGLWGWSRHPNYFFEWFCWLAYPVIAIDTSYAWGWLALAAPALMYWLLVYVSGVPLLERHLKQTRGEAYENYRARVSTFFPAPPRRA